MKNVKDEKFKTDLNDLGRMDRRTFVKVAGTTVGAIAFGTGLSKLIEPAMGAPVQLTKFVDALPIPPVATAGSNRKYRGADYYEISMNKLLNKFHRDLPSAYAYGYGGASYLGPTIVAKKGRKV
ncbi:MAG: twin-arginine translocation signal domain-containing protein, partial [Candidatus Methanoperedens sp.]|nr:twin-arginine translocation signal domain-containing protein [Candidatus Methanoperedens sp.]